MAQCRVAVLVAFLLCCGVLADFNQYGYCSTGSTTPLKGNNGVFGCNGYSAGTMSFNLTTTKTIFVSFNSFSLSYSTTLQVFSPSGSYTFSTNAPASSMTLPAGLTTFVLTSAYSWNAPYGFEVIITDNFYSLQPGQPMTLQAVQPGGFVYFVLPSLSYGAYLNIQLAVNSYDGFMSPALFAQLNTLPTLSSYAYYNTSSGSSSHPKVSIGIKNPQNAVYVIGVFLYGSSSSLTLSALWNFTFNFLSNGQVVNTDTVKNQFYQIQVPMQTPQLTLRISRQLPGGYVVGYVGAGYLPSTTQYNYKLDTTQQSYIQLQIKKPYNATSATPGLYVFNFVSAYGGDAGYIFEASWGNNQTDALTLEQFESKSKRQATIIYDNADN